MTLSEHKYEVAISFLSRDKAIAEAINDELAKIFRVFYFPDRQEVLVGTDGMESLRKPFFEESLVSVVLYREPWGESG